MNLLFICIDCLRTDILNSEDADTPFLDSLMDEGLFAENMFSTTSTTTPCVASYFTGCYSEKNGVNTLKEVELNSEIKTLAEKLQETGYKTHAETVGPLVEETELDRGFDNYNFRSVNETLYTDWGNELKQKISDIDEDTFFYVHLWELHKPKNLPEEYDKKEYGENKYARTLSALDRKIEEIVDSAPEDSIVVINGDHGESISWEDNFIRDNLKKGRTFLRYILGLNTRPIEIKLNRFMDRFSPDYKDHFIEDGHAETVFDFTTNVPLIINSDSIEPENVEKQVRQIDIFPTLLDLLDVDHSREIDGSSLFPLDELSDRKAYIRACGESMRTDENWVKSVRKNNWKLITHPERDWKPELYNLEKDPKELRPVKDKEKIQEMKKEIPDEELLESKELEIKDRLKDLGYM